MPLINPPKDNDEPELLIVDEARIFTEEDHARIKEYLNVPNWRCPNCGCVNFGRNRYCPYNRHGVYCNTPRPTEEVK